MAGVFGHGVSLPFRYHFQDVLDGGCIRARCFTALQCSGKSAAKACLSRFLYKYIPLISIAGDG